MRFNLKTALLTAIVGSCAISGWAVPAKPGLLTKKQPDGTTVNVRLYGDENHHFYMSEDGYYLVEDGSELCYADIDASGALISSGIKAADINKRSADAIRFLSKVETQLVRESINKRAAVRKHTRTQQLSKPTFAAPRKEPGVGLFPGTSFPAIGEQKALVILVEYKDVKMTLSDAHDYFSRMLNENGFSDYNGTGSAKDYFRDSSDGQFLPEFDVFGPVTLSQNRSYYGGNDWYGQDMRPAEMINEACQLLDDEIDFAEYDRDNDGYIDNVFVFYAGQGEASYGSSDTIWPHSWDVSAGLGYSPQYDGVSLNRYGCTNEYQEARPDGVGTFIHEFSHVMGLPDLYSTNYSGAFTPGGWSCLDFGPYNNDGCTPPLYGAFERYALGWLDPIVVDLPANATLPPIAQNKAAIIKTAKDTEFFLLENRQQQSWDTYIPWHGMLIWHIDYYDDIWTNNTVNNSSWHQYVDIEEADGTQDQFDRDGDPFPGAEGITSFTDATSPNMKTWSGSSLGKPLTGIAETPDGLITFNICGGRTEQLNPPTPFTPTETTTDGFTASWDGDSEHIYILTVYTRAENAARQGTRFGSPDASFVPVPEYDHINVGKVTSYQVTGIDSSVQHYYTIATSDGWECSPESDPMAVFPETSVGITDISGSDNATPEYFNLQGMKVDNPGPGIYIVKTAGSIRKVILK